MNSLLYLFVFLFGLAVGSFLNVLILRVNTGATLKGRSRCFSCLKQLSWHDLVPLISFLIISGRCRYCRSKISIQYPIVEFLTGVLFAGVAYFIFGASITDVSYINIINFVIVVTFFSILIAISAYDIRHKIIPDQFSVALFAVALIKVLLAVFTEMDTVSKSWPSDIAAGFAAFVFFAGIWLVSHGKWMGLGDAKIAFPMGLLLGYPAILIALLVAFWAGALYGLGMLAIGKYTRKSEVPFGPFLAFGTVAAYFFISSNLSVVLFNYLGLYSL